MDIEYHKELHNEHNAYPLAPEQLVVQKEWYQLSLLSPAESEGVAPSKVIKLIPNLRDKKSYVFHCQNLELYMSFGLQLQKIHRALKFEQSSWMEPYIRMNAELRKQPTTVSKKTSTSSLTTPSSARRRKCLDVQERLQPLPRSCWSGNRPLCTDSLCQRL